MDTPSRLQLYLSEARRKGIKMLLPDINKSGVGFIPEPRQGETSNLELRTSSTGAIRTGFALVKNLGARGIKEILKAREEGPFTGFFNFCRRTDRRAVTSKALESLILSGAFDAFGIPRPALLLSLKSALLEAKSAVCGGGYSGQLCLLPEESPVESLARDVFLPDFSPEQKINQELSALGHYITVHPMEMWEDMAAKLRTHTAADVDEINKKKRVRLTGILLDPRWGRTRNGGRMMFVQLEDLTGAVELVIFPREMKLFSPYLFTGSPVIVEGWTDLNDDGHRTVVVGQVRSLKSLAKSPATQAALDYRPVLV
jgi:DNA polymerase-3 subunit alpha